MADIQIHELATISRDPVSTDVFAIDTGTLTLKVPFSTLTQTVSALTQGGILADEYSTSRAYAFGDLCLYNGKLYRCTTPIPSGEAWTSGHWALTDAGDEIPAGVRPYTNYTAVNNLSGSEAGSLAIGDFPVNRILYISSAVHPSALQSAFSDEPCFRFFGTVVTLSQSMTSKVAALQIAMTAGSSMGDELYYRRGTSTGWEPWVQIAKSAFIAPAYSSASTYAVGEYVTYSGGLYRCITAISTAESWTAAHWTNVTVGTEIASVRSTANANSANTASAYSSSSTYAIGDYCIYNGTLYKCNTAITTAESWTAAHWEACKTSTEIKNCLSSLPNFISLYGLTSSAANSLKMADFPVDRCVYINSSIHPSDTTQTAFSDEPFFRFTGVVFTISQTQSSITGSIQIACGLSGDEFFWRRGQSSGMNAWRQAVPVSSLAPRYSDTSTYAKGDYCFYQGNLRQCNTAIATPEPFTSAHWTTKVVGNVLKDLENRISALE